MSIEPLPEEIQKPKPSRAMNSANHKMLVEQLKHSSSIQFLNQCGIKHYHLTARGYFNNPQVNLIKHVKSQIDSGSYERSKTNKINL